MAKQLNVNMSFTADTSNAKQAIQQLQADIQKLGSSTIPTEKMVNPQAFRQAAASARELAAHLNQAYNANTGNLDLSKLHASLQQSNTSLTALTSGFSKAGSIGQKAFISLANAVANADMPALSLNTHLQTMLITLKNVARFQISSSIIHGAIGAIQKAYGYAQDLNESLNNIRIVTGQGTEQMAKFAEEANKAAKSLSASTLDYTDAALIYYQQGLNNKQVKERTEVTLKMANVSRQSAESVSDQMTAIWNNFDNGSKSLEYYADVITALGAATAASSSEISTGMEKFAAVADTVGLSYENAAASVATIVAATRQSAETVGTGLRTLFSRLQGLKLGETLEDGVDLNKYSAALASVGVYALDASGNLRDMDDILEDLGARWGELSKAQQTALAQTVGGVRQYTNLIALMDNFDFYKQNQKVAENAEGTLQHQADIYASGWEAAQKRVETASQALFKTLINEDFFIKFDGFLEHMLNGINSFLDAFGGLKGLLIAIGGIVMNVIGNKIGPLMSKVVQDIQVMMGGADFVARRMQTEMGDMINQQLATGNYTGAQAQELTNAQELLIARSKLDLVSKNMTASEKLRAETAINGLKAEQDAIVQLIEKQEALIAKQKENNQELNSYKLLSNKDFNKIDETAGKQISNIPLTNKKGELNDKEIDKVQKTADTASTMLATGRSNLIDAFTSNTNIDIVKQQLTDLGVVGKQAADTFKNMNASDLSKLKTEVTSLKDNLSESTLKSEQVQQAFDKIANIDIMGQNGPEQLKNAIEELFNTLQTQDTFDFAKLFNTDTAFDFSNLKNQINTSLQEALADGVPGLEDFKAEIENTFNGLSEHFTPEIFEQLWDSFYDGTDSLNNFKETLQQLGLENNPFITELLEKFQEFDGIDLSSIKNQIDLLSKGFGDTIPKVKGVQTALVQIQKARSPKELLTGINKLKTELEKAKVPAKDIEEMLERLNLPKSVLTSWKQGRQEMVNTTLDVKKGLLSLAENKLDFSHVITGTEVFAKMGGTIMSTYTIANSLRTLFATWKDPDTTFGEKMMSSLMSIGMLIPAVTTAFGGLQTALDFVNQAAARHAVSASMMAAASGVAAAAAGTNAAAQQADALAASLVSAGYEKETAAKIASTFATVTHTAGMTAEAQVQALVDAGLKRETATRLINNGAITAGSLIRAAFAVLTGKMTKEEFKLMIVQAKETGSVWLNTAAWIANQIAKNGWAGIVLGAVLVATIAVTTGIIAHTAKVKADTEAQAEAAEKTRDHAKSLSEERDELVKTEKAWDKAYKKYKETGEVTDELTQATKDITEAYELENAQLLIAAGLYDEINEKIKTQSKLKGEAAEKALRDSLTQTAVEYGKKQDTNNTGAYWASTSTVGIEGASGSKEWRYFDNAVKELKNEDVYGDLLDDVWTQTGDLLVRTDSETALGYIQQYEAVQATLDRAVENAKKEGKDITNTGLYKNTVEYLSNMKETYDQLKEAQEKLKNTSLDNILLSSEDVDNIDKYETFIQDSIKKLKEQTDDSGNRIFSDEEAEKYAKSFAEATYPTFAALEQGLTALSKKDAQLLKEKWHTYTAAEQQYIIQQLGLAVDLGQQIELPGLETGAENAERIALALQAATEADFWKLVRSEAEGGKKTFAEWEATYDDATNKEYFEKRGITKEQFLAATNKQKSAWAQEAQKAADQDKATLNAQAYESNKNTRDTLQKQIDQTLNSKYEGGSRPYTREEAEEILEQQIADNTYYGLSDPTGRVGRLVTKTQLDAIDAASAALAAELQENGYKNTEKYNELYAARVQAFKDAGFNENEFAYFDDMEQQWGNKKYSVETGDWGYAALPQYMQAWQTKMANDNARIEYLQDQLDPILTSITTYEDAQNDTEQHTINSLENMETELEYLGIDTDKFKTFAQKHGISSALDLFNTNQKLFNTVEESGIGAQTIFDYADKLSDKELFTDLGADELLNISANIQQFTKDTEISADTITDFATELSEMSSFANFGAQDLTQLSMSMQQMAKDTELNVDDIAEYTNYLMTLDKFTGASAQEVAEFATAALKLDRGFTSLKTDGKEWLKTLKDGKAGAKDASIASKGLSKALADITNKQPQIFTDDWIKEHEDVVQKLIDGDEDAFEELFKVTSSDWFGDSFAEINNKYDWTSNNIRSKLQGLQTATEDFLTNQYPTMEIGDYIQDSSFYSKLAAWVAASGASAEEIQNYFDSIGMEPEYETITLPEKAAHTAIQNGMYTDPATGISYPISNQTVTDDTGETTITILKARKKAGAPTKPSGGGGGGGGGNKKPPKPERYHVIKNKIENNDRRTEAVTRNKDRAFGTAKLDLLKEEQKLREKNLELQQQYAKEIEDWLAKDKEDLIKAYQDLGLAVEFDEDGEISNFEELQQAYLDAFEDLDEEGEEAWKDAQEALEQYEESLDLLNDKLDEIEQAAQEAFDALLEEVELKVQLDIDISDDKMAYLDYLLEKIDDDAYAAAQAIALLGDKTAETMRKIETYQNGINDILNLHGLTMDDLNNLSPDELRNLGLTDQEVSDLREYRDALLDANKELLKMRTTIVDKVIDAFEQLNEKVQKAYEKFDQYNSVLEHYKNLSDLLIPSLGKQSKILMDQLNNAMFNNAKNQATAARKVYEEAQKQWDEAKAGYDAAVASGDDNAIKEYERILDTLTENLNEAQDNWLSAWEASLEQAQVIFEAAMEDIQAEYDATLGGTFGSLDYLQQAYDRQKELNDQYLQDYDRLYELSKLSRNISAAIDDTDSIKAKERLRALQAEINKLQADGTKLSEYDVQVLEKRFEIEKARLALDDAQNAKSQVRLQRDAEGNWGYVYTADEDAVAKAEQEYEDKLHEYQQLNDEYITQLQDQALEVQAQYRDAYMEIMNDTSLTDEERKARVDELNNWLAGQMNFFNEQLEHALTNQHSTLQRYYDAYGDLNAQLVDTWGETTLAEVLGMETMEGFMGNWQGAVDQMISAAAAAWENYRRQQDEANEAAGVSTEDVADHIASQISAIGTYSDEAKDQVSQLSEELTGEFTDAMKAALEWEEKYAQAIDDAVNKNEAFIISLNKMITALAGLEGQISWDFSGATQSSEQFGSGGYTGAWGPNGKLAVLHEKELVLNKEDTAKFLDALQILKMIDLSANWMQQGFGDFISAPTIGELAQTLDQQVSINASFPGVKDRYEIEEAFNNLVNKASQYANRKESY